MTQRHRSPALVGLALGALALAGPSPAVAANPFESLGRKGVDELPVAATREFASDDLQRAQRLAIAALQDLGFVLESADAAGGTLTASRLDAHALRISITLTESDEDTLTASVLTDYAGVPIADPRAAEAFFGALAAQLAPPAAFD